MIIRSLLIILICLILSCCSNESSSSRLSAIEELASISPNEALDSLSNIDYNHLSKTDQHYYDFLSVKVPDKAYNIHSSDSLILEVIKYESKHKSNRRYPEALYYGGRVYSDLGDFPTALHFFHLSLNELRESNTNTELECRVLSQTGRLLTSMSLYEEAIPYIRAALNIEKQENDTLKIIHDLILLGGAYLRSGDYHPAECYFRNAYYLSNGFSEKLAVKSKMYLAAVKHKAGQLDSAIYFIKDAPYRVNPLIRNSALGYASTIYLDAGVLDSAYLYADELIHSTDEAHKEIGYQVILSPALRNYIQTDSINSYICTYRQILEEYYNENMAQLTINQQAFYNYQQHERKRASVENSNKFLKKLIIGFLLVFLILIIVILVFKNRYKNNIIKLQKALHNIDILEKSLQVPKNSPIKSEYKDDIDSNINHSESISGLRERLRNKLLSLYNNSTVKATIHPNILQSEPYNKLQSLISKESELKEDSKLWDELESMILECSPNFKSNLLLLVGGKLTTYDLHTSILIKCGVSPTQMTILFNRTKGAIVSRRESLCLKVFDRKLGTKVIDGIIRLL